MNLPKIITYKELMIVYGFNLAAAQHKLCIIRSILGKKRFQTVLIAEFCEAENIPVQLFTAELVKELQKFGKKSLA